MSTTPNELRELIAKHAQDRAAQDADEARQQWLSQVEKGRCNVVPLPVVATQPFRSELSVEQNSLFVANRYKGHCFIREWEVPHPSGSGEPVRKKVTVGEPDPRAGGYGVLKQIHQDVFYKLLQLWAERQHEIEEAAAEEGKEARIVGSFTVSAYKLVKAIRGHTGAEHYKRVRILLRQLASIPVRLEQTYAWQSSKDIREFTLLDGVHWEAKNVDASTFKPKEGGKHEVTIRLSKFVTEGFMKKRVKALLAQPYDSLNDRGRGGELAKLLYPYLDCQLAKKASYHVRLESLLAHFGLAAYRHKSKRKEKVTQALSALRGKAILGGKYVLRLSLRESADGKDYVLTAHKDPANQVPLFEE